MMDAVLTKLIEQLNTSVFVLLVILGAAFYSIYRIGKWTEKFSAHDEKIKSVDGIAEKIIVLTTKIDLIYQNTNPRALVAAHSPISLTPIGKEIADKIGADRIFESHLSPLVSAVDTESPKNAYDIQVVSMKVAKEKMLSLLNEKDLTIIKDEAFTKGILVEDVMSVFGVLLRNKILSNKGIPIVEVDIHDPATKK